MMTESDIDPVRHVEAAAFSAWWKGMKGQQAELPCRTRTNLLSLLDKDPQGCFVAEIEGQVVGFIFSRTWGSVGWFGTFGVLPDFQGRGIGKQLVGLSLEYLRQKAGRLIGLETNPESAYNQGLYLQRGFEFRFPTLMLSKPLQPFIEAETTLLRWVSADETTRQRWLRDLQVAWGRIHPGLDYSREIIITAQRHQGEIWLLEDQNRAVGMSVVWHESPREGIGDEAAIVQVMALHPDFTNEKAFYALIQASEFGAAASSKQKIIIAINTCHTWALKRLLEWGYRVDRTVVRMVLTGSEPPLNPANLVDLNRWAG
jgi:ribosomal protein S18 acetylase RimI-like enzyme